MASAVLDKIPVEKRIELVVRTVYEDAGGGPGGTDVIRGSVRDVRIGEPPGGWTALADLDSADGRITVEAAYDGNGGYSDVVVMVDGKRLDATYSDDIWQEFHGDSADELLERIFGLRTDAPKGKGGKRGKRTEKPECSKGRSCGMSCVDMDDQCAPDLSTVAKMAADEVARRGSGGGGNQNPFDPAVNPLSVPDRPRRQNPNQDPFDPATNPLNVPNRPRQQPARDPFDPRVNPLNVPDLRSNRPASAPGKVRASLMPPIDRNAPNAFEKFQARQNSVEKLRNSLMLGRFNPLVDGESERVTNGKMGALNALSDALNPKVGLLASTNANGEYTGFMSIKEGRNSIEISNFGTDGSQPGSGRAIFNQALEYAARAGKGLDTSPVESAIGFYQKMGMKGEMGNMSMTAEEVREAVARNSQPPPAPAAPRQPRGGPDLRPIGPKIEDDTYRDGLDGWNESGSVYKPTADYTRVNSDPDPDMVEAFRRGEMNVTLALIKYDPREDIYTAADPVSDRILASAKAAGTMANAVVVRPGDEEFAQTLQSANKSIVMKKEGDSRGMTDVSTMMKVPVNQVTGGNVTATQEEIDAAATAIREQGGGRALLPVPVRQLLGGDRYEVVDNANMLAAAQRAGVDPWIYVVEEEKR